MQIEPNHGHTIDEFVYVDAQHIRYGDIVRASGCVAKVLHAFANHVYVHYFDTIVRARRVQLIRDCELLAAANANDTTHWYQVLAETSPQIYGVVHPGSLIQTLRCYVYPIFNHTLRIAPIGTYARYVLKFIQRATDIKIQKSRKAALFLAVISEEFPQVENRKIIDKVQSRITKGDVCALAICDRPGSHINVSGNLQSYYHRTAMFSEPENVIIMNWLFMPLRSQLRMLLGIANLVCQGRWAYDVTQLACPVLI